MKDQKLCEKMSIDFNTMTFSVILDIAFTEHTNLVNSLSLFSADFHY